MRIPGDGRVKTQMAIRMNRIDILEKRIYDILCGDINYVARSVYLCQILF